MPTHPLYDTIVERLKATDTDETTYLDVGCCFGQDLRQLVHDGVPSDRLIGLDIAGVLMELGYDFFHDRETLESKFVVADVFKGPEQGSVWTQLQERGVDVMHCSAFFHLFTLEEQVAAAKHLAGLVKRGGIIVGRQIGSVKPGNVPAIKEQSFSYRHDVNTFEAMWREVGEATQTRWKVEGTMDSGYRPYFFIFFSRASLVSVSTPIGGGVLSPNTPTTSKVLTYHATVIGINTNSPVEDENSRRFLFTVTRIE